MKHVTGFDIRAKYIFLPIVVSAKDGTLVKFSAILDSGAPQTEFSDAALYRAGFLERPKEDIQLTSGLSTKKYDRMILPQVAVCSHSMNDLEVYVSHFDKFWGIDALIGLDFFRMFRVTIDYKKGQLLTESL